jgi:hypothetical protein
MYDKDLICNRATVSSPKKTGRHDITEILLKVVLNTINQPILPTKKIKLANFKGNYDVLHNFIPPFKKHNSISSLFFTFFCEN